jgi:PAS domain S-box-containing protein
MVWASGADGGREYANERWYDYTGMPRDARAAEGEGGGIDWLRQLRPDDREPAATRWRDCLRTGQAFQAEFRIRSRAGEYRWFAVRARPLRDPEGQAARWFGSCTDVEDDRRLAEEREALLTAERNARAEVERAMRMRDDFVATLSHELRTPLTSIIGWTSVLKRGLSDPEQLRRAVEVIDRNAKLQTQMVDDLLDMSRILSGKLRLDVQRLDLAVVIEAAVETVRPAAEAKGVKLIPVFGSAGLVRGDASRLQQVVWNLLSNAIKFTLKGGRVQVAHRKVGSQIEISVSDTGQGIAPQFLPHVFDRFRQADSSITRQKGGLGLGLSIVRSIVEMHGGTVSVLSAGEGQGSTFTERLPMAVLHGVDPGTADPHSSAQEVPLADRMLTDLRMLVLDDDPDSRELVSRVLGDEGALVHVAGSVQEALEVLAQRGPVDAILSDISLPGEDGYSFIRKVRQSEGPAARTPAIALTALARSEDRRRALLAGFQTHVAKPVDPAELVAVIASLTDRTGPCAEPQP